METNTTRLSHSFSFRILLLFLIGFLSSTVSKGQDVSGTDFWFTLPNNGSALSPTYDVTIVSAGYPVTGVIKAGTTWSSPITITAAGRVKINIPAARIPTGKFVKENSKGLHITTDTPVSVYAVAYGAASVDGEAIMPTAAMCGTDFVAASYSEGDPLRVTVVATQANTTVNFYPNRALTNSPATPAGGTLTITGLNEAQAYTIESGNSTAFSAKWLSGSRITADKPVFIMGSTSTIIDCGAYDVVMSPMMPVSTWGTKYITAQVIPRLKRNQSEGAGNVSDYIEMIAGPTAATVTIDHFMGGTVTQPTPAYGRWFFDPPSPSTPDINGYNEGSTVITSSSPIQVYQWMRGWQCDGQNVTDAECTLVHPESSWRNEYRFSVVSYSGTVNSLVIVTKKANNASLDSVKVDGAYVSSNAGALGWKKIGTTNYYYEIVQGLSDNVHTITGKNNLSIYVSTQGSAESFITQGGAPFLYISTPLNLISFDVKITGANKIETNWVTASEQNTSQFIIERSKDGINFEQIGQVKAAGNSSDTRNYSFTDNTPYYGLNYYRLKEMDIDGKANLSMVKILEFNKDKVLGIISLQPNPANDKTTLVYTSGSSGVIQYKIINIIGQEVKKGLIENVNEGNNEYSLDISSLNKGIYYLIAQKEDSDEMIKVKLVKE